ncbi:NADH:ubiquinone reductase (Na(+)-transporting) subunit A [Devosia beringensis]|uniref:NADH:ubiquinone reductase (Na(+)-transporting) subunit A n=1 Tax=Devosia beringensis TaxID=2657486 RepID=UPI00186B7933|nr:NADH:ubiquinone reductase (Na(+)-transporting) subunit A [Devosia beringensis]
MAGGHRAVRIRQGLDLDYAGAPRQVVDDTVAVTAVAVLGSDYPGLRLEPLVVPGARVQPGQPVLRDRRQPERLVVAPAAGTVGEVRRGPRRSIEAVTIAVGDAAGVDFPMPTTLDRSALVSLLHASGLWAGILSRPFGRPADLEATPAALFLTAMDSRPHAADAAMVIAEHLPWFQRGAAALRLLTPGPCYLCHEAAHSPAPLSGITPVGFAGPHPAGLPGTHIHHLHPVGRMPGVVWQIGYTDVIALGHLLATGQVWTTRIIALSGPAVTDPVLLRVPPGARLHDLVAGRLVQPAVRLYSGSALDGRVQDFLARDHLQVFALHHHAPAAPLPPLLHRLQAWMGTGIPALIPNGVHERVAPPGILPIPLLRALSTGDVDMARQLGALALVEDDLALLSHVDGAGTDYGVMLRAVLDELAPQP